MRKKKDYYTILGVSRDATPDEIKRAFRTLAKRFHPDVYDGERAFAEARFKEISEAYEVLIDPEKRANYDRYGHEGVDSTYWRGGFDWNDFTHFGDLEDIFGFGGDLFSGLFARRSAERTSRRGMDLRMDISVDLKDVATGTREHVRVRRTVRCPFCRGSGARRPEDIMQCSQCEGTGKVRNVRSRGFASFVTITTCTSCRGAGHVIGRACLDCKGAGMREIVDKVSITVPAGVEDGSRLRVSGMGNEDRSTGISGDLYIVIHVKDHRDFERYGNHLIHDLYIPYTTAVLGGKVSIPLLTGGKHELTIPPGTPGGEIMVIKGKGLPQLDGGGRGDLHVRVNITVPKKVSKEERELLRRLERIQKERGSVIARAKKGLFTGNKK